MSEICTSCRKALTRGQTCWSTVQTMKQTHWSPAEYEELPFCWYCLHNDYDEIQREAAAEKRWEQRTGR